ncbi:GIY-YIG nuclease family protein, partial [bacterium]|nr:GIY-YIG nuclease family protein [bacterium]
MTSLEIEFKDSNTQKTHKMRGVYVLRYSYWDHSVWKIGMSQKDIRDRVKANAANHFKDPDIVLVKECQNASNEESTLHKFFRKKRVPGRREYFKLSDLDLTYLTANGFREFIGRLVFEQQEIEELDKEYSAKRADLKMDFANKLFEEMQRNASDIDALEKEVLTNLHDLKLNWIHIENEHNDKLETIRKRANEAAEVTVDVAAIQQKCNTIEIRLKKFIEEKTRYKQGNVIFIETIRKKFNDFMDTRATKLDNRLFGT